MAIDGRPESMLMARWSLKFWMRKICSAWLPSLEVCLYIYQIFSSNLGLNIDNQIAHMEKIHQKRKILKARRRLTDQFNKLSLESNRRKPSQNGKENNFGRHSTPPPSGETATFRRRRSGPFHGYNSERKGRAEDRN